FQAPVASEVWDTATHCMYGVVETANCIMTQRFASWSYMTIGSPLLSVEQRPPKPDQRVFPAAGPYTSAPVDLLNTAKEVFTHCTYWVAPAAPLVSGGAPVGE